MRKHLLFTQASSGILHFFYPEMCLACEAHPATSDDVFCVECSATLPYLNYHLQKDNPFTVRFWGRIPLHSGTAMFLFTKGSRVQHLLHNLKYNGKWQIGVELGKKLGWMLAGSDSFTKPDVIVPVPLHERKEWSRGYNQSAMFAKGLSSTLGVAHLPKAMIRKAFTETQTRKTRIERLMNVREAFEVSQREQLAGKHVLLVDDVLTTGSTLEACALKILEIAGTKVSMATIAIASHF